MLLELDLFAGIEVLLGQTKVLPESGWGGARLRIIPAGDGAGSTDTPFYPTGRGRGKGRLVYYKVFIFNGLR
jgi:hypothetical protein